MTMKAASGAAEQLLEQRGRELRRLLHQNDRPAAEHGETARLAGQTPRRLRQILLAEPDDFAGRRGDGA